MRQRTHRAARGKENNPEAGMALSMEKVGMSEVSENLEKATYDKVFWRCVPLFFLCYMVSYLDRVNNRCQGFLAKCFSSCEN
jgi:hypothetical protein